MDKKSKKLSVLNLQLPTRLHQRLKVMAADRDRSVSAETRRAIEERLARYEGENDKASE